MFLKPLDSQKFSNLMGTKAFHLESRRHALAIMAEMERNGKDGFPILLQEYIPGPAGSYFLVDGFVDRHGQTLGLIARRRHRMYPAPFGNSTLSETIPVDQVQGAINTLERIWSATKYCGVFDAEFKYDQRDGQFKIVEINARPWWFVEFATRCGVNVCQMSYRHALGLPAEPIRTYPAHRRCSYMLYDFAAHRSMEPGLRGYLRWIRSVKGCDEITYCWDDPGPALSLAMRTARKQFKRTLSDIRRRLHFAAPVSAPRTKTP
jgi:predicted ATP-grasp superfamily ATP-dependent carboligase